MAETYLYLLAMFLCLVQSALSAFSYVWHRRYIMASMEGNRIIRNKIIAMGCLVLAAGIMFFCTTFLPLTLYNCLTNANMVLVTVFAYFILNERINKWQVGTLMSLVISSTCTAICVKPSLSSEFVDALTQEKLGKESLRSTGTLTFLITTSIFQLGCIFAMARQQYRISQKAEKELAQLDKKSRESIVIDSSKRLSVLSEIFALKETPSAFHVLKAIGFEHNYAWDLTYYFYLVLGIHLISFHPSMHGAMIKFVAPIIHTGDRQNSWENWACLAILPTSWILWLMFTGWLVTCFDANLATPLVYATQSLYGIIVGIVIMQERPEFPILFSISAGWMILSSAMFAIVRDKEDVKANAGALSTTEMTSEVSKKEVQK